MVSESAQTPSRLSSVEFRKKLRNLILVSWNIPPIFGLSFILFINVLSVEQVVGILTTPLEPSFIIVWVVFSVWYFSHYLKPVENYLANPDLELAELAAVRIRNFPMHYWGLFLTYLLLAPGSVIIAAETFTDFVAQPVDWFRIHLVALIVSIIVGLPIFFLILDLFGRVMETIPLSKPHVTIKMKVFLIGALIPLLIDTMLVQYYWTRTGFFNAETFMVWLVLELLAVGGSLIFVRSFTQSLSPLESLSREKGLTLQVDLDQLVSESTDEIGVLTKNYRRLLSDLKIQGEMLELNNLLLSKTGYEISIDEIANTVIGLCESSLEVEKVFLILFDEQSQELVGVAQSGSQYKEEGYYRLNLDEVSMAVMVFKAGETFAIDHVQEDPRCSPRMRARFNVQSALATPLIVEARPIGVLMAVTESKRHKYSDRDVTIIEGFAREVALAIHTHRLYLSKIAAEAKGKEQQEHIQLLMQSTGDAIYGVDLKGICTFVNPACLRILGYDDESELIGKNLHELIHHTMPDGTHYPKEECKVRVGTTKGISSHADDEVHWRKDGTSFPVEYWSYPIRKEGEIVGTVVSFVDISDRIKAEQSLLESEEKYRALFELAGDSIFIMRGEKLVDCNQKTLDVFSCTREQFIGKTPKEFSSEQQPDGQDSYEKVMPLINKALEGENQYFEWLCRRPNGSLFPADVVLSRLQIGEESLVQVILRDISERKEAEQTIRHMAYHDALTGLVNRHEFENRLEHALQSVKQRGVEHALLYLDLDQFKVVNDTSGHEAGDELLKQLARLIQEPVRERDTVARLGGDEFGILLENCPVARAESIANQIVRLVREFRFVWRDKTFSVGASIGISLIDNASQSKGEVLKTADMACYMSKELGRNRVHLFTLGDAELLKRETEMSLISHIHDALDNDRFILYAQSIQATARTAKQKSYREVFVRMIDKQGKIIPADSFVASAERYNLMPEIDRWVIRKTFAYAAGIKANKLETLFFINLSGNSFNDESFLAFVQDQLTREMLDPARICFEVTETAAIANINQAQKFIHSVKALGCRFALDDFGSGLSSFTYLKELDVDFLKIDGAFVRDIVHDQKDRSIVEAITQLGRAMKIQTIAEFIEDDAIMAMVKEIGVDFGQGYGIQKPEPLEN